MNFATIEAASINSIANTNVESTFKSTKKSAPGGDALWRPQYMRVNRISIRRWPPSDSITKTRRISDGLKTKTFMQNMAFE